MTDPPTTEEKPDLEWLDGLTATLRDHTKQARRYTAELDQHRRDRLGKQ